MKIKRLFTYDRDGNCKKFNYKGKYSRAAVYTASYGANLNTLSSLIGCRRAKVLRKVLVPRKWGLI